jgi:hypothetical protein
MLKTSISWLLVKILGSGKINKLSGSYVSFKLNSIALAFITFIPVFVGLKNPVSLSVSIEFANTEAVVGNS